MSLITRMMKQAGVWWKQKDTNEDGSPVFESPIQIECRWEDIHEEFIDAKGDKKMSDSVVYVDRDMTVGDVLLLGTLTWQHRRSNPLELAGAYEVKNWEKLPNLRNTEYLRTAIL